MSNAHCGLVIEMAAKPITLALETGPQGPEGKPGPAVEIDATLSISGEAADAKAAGDAIRANAEELADQKSAIEDLEDLVDRKAGMLVDTASGSIASFVPDATIPDLLGVTVDVEPVQDLNGYDSPWPGGGGKNKLRVTATTQTINGVTFTVNDDGSVNVNGTATANAILILNSYDFDETAAILNGCPSGGSVSTFRLDAYGASGLSEDTGSGVTISTSGTRNIRIVVFSGTTITNKLFTPMIRLASVTDATYAPYSNICPISGWDSVEVMHSGADTSDPTTYTITLGQTVYGCKLTLAEDGSVTALVDRAMVDLGTETWSRQAMGNTYRFLLSGFHTLPGAKTSGGYDPTTLCSMYKSNGAPLSGNSIDDCYCVYNGVVLIRDDSYSTVEAFSAAMSGVRLVYPLATPVEITLDPVTISTISGQTNNVWADAGDVTVEFAADIKRYIDSKIAAAVAALS